MPLNRPIFLLGMPGSGKTKAGSRLAAKLGVPFMDLDQYIKEKENKSIQQLFQEHGEVGFRPLERHYLEQLAIMPDPMVISLGGGTPCFFDNMLLIKSKGLTVYLDVPIGTIVSRITAKTPLRPLLKDKNGEELKQFLEQMLRQREQYYQQAEIKVNGVSLDVAQLAKMVTE